jgi:ribonuclease-3
MALDGALEPDFQARSLSAARRPADLAELEASLGYVFADRGLLTLALTHVGAAQNRLRSYQRLEFLGDRVLGLVVADMLQTTFPLAEEGELSKRLADLVRRESCAAVATRWNVAPHIRLGAGEARSDSLKRAILGDICEAIIGAVYLDGGFAAAATLVRGAFEAQMLAPLRPLRDPKTTLQEWAQAKGLAVPTYRECGRSGPDHAPEFTVAVVVDGYAEIEAKGASKRLAEQAVAAAFMTRAGLTEPNA